MEREVDTSAKVRVDILASNAATLSPRRPRPRKLLFPILQRALLRTQT